MSNANPVDHSREPDDHQLEQAPVGSTPRSEPNDDSAVSFASGDVATDAVAECERWRQEVQRANDRVLRSQAELENFRKRARREMEDERRYAALPLLVDLLGVVDNLDRAIAVAEGSDQTTGLREGVKMVVAQMAGVLAKHNCHSIDAIGQVFDPHLHEALVEVPSDEFPAGTVSQVARQGYRLHDRVVRPTQVLVSKGPEASG